MTRAISASLIWVDGAFRTNRVLLVQDRSIAGIAESDALPPDALREDWGHVAIVPGTVNAHGHSFQSLLKGFADDRAFASWRDDVLYPFSDALDGDAVYAGALFAFAEALLAGATTTVDFFYLHDSGNDNARQVVRAAHDVGIRLVLARTLYDPDAPTKAPLRYREPAAESIARLNELAHELRDDPLVGVQPAPHSLHAAVPETIAAALDAARALEVPCHLHLAEARYEVEQVRSRYGTSPVRLLEREGLLDERLLTVHTVWVDDEELDMLAAHDVGVVHCPGANAFLGDGIARVPEMLERGIRVALGPDGGCANNRQSVFDEMRSASLMAKARLTSGDALDAPTAFDLGTRGGAELLRLPVGSLQAGLRADVVALNLDDLSLHPLQTVERQMVHSMQATAIERVMVDGEVVVEGGRLTRVSNDKVAELVAAATDGWTRP